MRKLIMTMILMTCALGATPAMAQVPDLKAVGTRFEWQGKPFPYTGYSFFNALYNPAFNQRYVSGWL